MIFMITIPGSVLTRILYSLPYQEMHSDTICRKSSRLLPCSFRQLRKIKFIFFGSFMAIHINSMQMFCKIRFTFPTYQIKETVFFPYKFTSAFSKYCFAKLCFLIQFSFQYQPWQTNACSNCIDILICLTGTPTFIQCLCISKIYFSQT